MTASTRDGALQSAIADMPDAKRERTRLRLARLIERQSDILDSPVPEQVAEFLSRHDRRRPA
ncbi:hypothetical protein GIS00_19480 [Nakamurella sp. YIM 132087]|uniref:Anti-sigma factor NepR domain-containing protein n=1 Tax=Nakamurella alba TaxID=2665158 RepID=A0A7K1FTJ7_9ACTN|nr:hypothetical protein [Nakamurella alba]MTD16124.1 hypothetical protein [Nakamurella alba]